MLSEQERRLRASLASSVSWANTTDRSGRTAKARATFEQQFLDAADGDPVRAKHLRDAYFKRLSLTALKSRRQAREAREAAAILDAEAANAEADLAAIAADLGEVA